MSAYVHALNATGHRWHPTTPSDACVPGGFPYGVEPFNPRHMMPRCGAARCPGHKGDTGVFVGGRFLRRVYVECLTTAVPFRTPEGEFLQYLDRDQGIYLGWGLCEEGGRFG